LPAAVCAGERGSFEGYNGTTRVEALTATQIEQLGYTVTYSAGFATLERNGVRIVATSWPIDPVHQVSERRRQETRADLPRDVGASQISAQRHM